MNDHLNIFPSAHFIFDLYDNEKHGIMDKASFRDILRDIYGESFEKSAQAKKYKCNNW